MVFAVIVEAYLYSFVQSLIVSSHHMIFVCLFDFGLCVVALAVVVVLAVLLFWLLLLWLLLFWLSMS